MLTGPLEPAPCRCRPAPRSRLVQCGRGANRWHKRICLARCAAPRTPDAATPGPRRGPGPAGTVPLGGSQVPGPGSGQGSGAGRDPGRAAEPRSVCRRRALCWPPEDSPALPACRLEVRGGQGSGESDGSRRVLGLGWGWRDCSGPGLGLGLGLEQRWAGARAELAGGSAPGTPCRSAPQAEGPEPGGPEHSSVMNSRRTQFSSSPACPRAGSAETQHFSRASPPPPVRDSLCWRGGRPVTPRFQLTGEQPGVNLFLMCQIAKSLPGNKV